MEKSVCNKKIANEIKGYHHTETIIKIKHFYSKIIENFSINTSVARTKSQTKKLFLSFYVIKFLNFRQIPDKQFS